MPTLLQVLQSFDAVLVGGQAVPSTLLEQAHQAGVKVRRTYGSSETAGGCVWDGRPLSGVTLREREGRIAIAGAMLAEGYIDNPAKTAEHFIHESGTRWYLTDDSGSLDSTGTLAIDGRMDDNIISGGIKVSLAQIERVIHDTTMAKDAVVVASPDDTWGQVPVLVSTTAVDRDSVRAELAKQFGVHARIDRVMVVDTMPMLASGKPDRRALTALVAGVRHG
jgi:O-succinylbenzoic acid--CoA ligase